MFKCIPCSYETDREFNFSRHCRGKRHLENVGNSYLCACGKIYTHKSSLSRHQRTCETHQNSQAGSVEDITEVTEELIKTLIAERREPSTMNFFNVQIYLDKECPDATSIQDFTDSMLCFTFLRCTPYI